MDEKRRMIYAHLPLYEVRPKVKPRIWKSRTDGWCCGVRGEFHVIGGATPEEAFAGWLSYQ